MSVKGQTQTWQMNLRKKKPLEGGFPNDRGSGGHQYWL
jgi:hypothetical protein